MRTMMRSSGDLAQPLLGDAEELKPVDGGTFKVKQHHLGFCPEEVILQIMPNEIALCNDDEPVAGYPFTNMVMWHASGVEFTLLLMNNLKRIVLETRSKRDARKIALRMNEVTSEIQERVARREMMMGKSMDASADMEAVEALSTSWDGMQEDELEDKKVFKVQQMHLRDEDQVCMLRVRATPVFQLSHATSTDDFYH
eukprot:COSAG06_NODE_141_length_22310_cov_9.973166_1_plen_198_part_00